MKDNVYPPIVTRDSAKRPRDEEAISPELRSALEALVTEQVEAILSNTLPEMDNRLRKLEAFVSGPVCDSIKKAEEAVSFS